MNGIIIVDKPADWTSHDVVAKLRGVLKTKRIGHGGTLDPMATGVLPVFVGRATRAAAICENAEKEYVAGLRLGITTDTQDITGNVTDMCDYEVSDEELLRVLPGFLGEQKQIPPMYSAIKIGGKKLYELARRGVELERPARDIVISEIELIGGGRREFILRVVCSKGTYIRTLCHDIGQKLGCGGTLSSLRRTRAHNFTIGAAHPLEVIVDAVKSGETGKIIMPVDSIFEKHPSITIEPIDVQKCKNGAAFRMDGADGKYRVYGPDGEFLMLGEITGGMLKTVKSFFEV